VVVRKHHFNYCLHLLYKKKLLFAMYLASHVHLLLFFFKKNNCLKMISIFDAGCWISKRCEKIDFNSVFRIKTCFLVFNG
jgi:hypothetical protein